MSVVGPLMRALKVDRLQQAMQLRGLSHKQLADLAGLSQASVSHALRGGKVRPSTIRALAKALHEAPTVPGADLIAGDAA